MKRLFTTEINEKYLNIAILILRLTAAAFMLTHGYPKLVKLFEGGEIRFADPIGLGAAASLVLVVFSEFICSILIGIGLLTRLASIPLIITMLVIAFISHGEDAFGRKEMVLLYLAVYIVLLIVGSGKFSIDQLISKSKDKK